MTDRELNNYQIGDDIAYNVGSMQRGVFLGLLENKVLIREENGNYVWELNKNEVFDVSLYCDGK